MKTRLATQRIYTRPGRRDNASGDFVCLCCKVPVSANSAMSGVCNRNHCPHCLSSRHLDHFEAGDRLSACKARMRPTGLTFKQVAKRYAGHDHGELMIVHVCEACGKVSINRIAADDDDAMILSLLETPSGLDEADALRVQLAENGIVLLSRADTDVVRHCLSGFNLPMEDDEQRR